MFMPRNDIQSWRSKVHAISNDDSYAGGELKVKQHYDIKEQRAVSSENLPDGSSVQELASLFSKLSLYDSDAVKNAQDENKSVIIGVKCTQQKHFPSSRHLSNTHDVRNNQNFLLSYFALPFQPSFSPPARHGSAVWYKSTNIGTECVETVLPMAENRDLRRQDYGNYCLPATQAVCSLQLSSFVINHSFIDPFTSFYLYRSRFSSFLENLLIRAGRLRENFGDFVRQNTELFIYDDSLSERELCSAEMQQKDGEFTLLACRIPSEQQGTYPEEQVTCIRHSQTLIAKELPLVRFLEYNTSMPEQDTYQEEELTLVEESPECVTPVQDIDREEEFTLVAEQENLTHEQDTYADEELMLVENLGKHSLTTERRIYQEEFTLVEERDVCIEEKHTSGTEQDCDGEDLRNCVRDIDNILADIDAHLRGVYGREDACIDGQETYFEGQETYLGGQETYLEGQETYLVEQETYLEEQETCLDGQENDLERQETYLEEQEIYLDGQETYIEEQVTCLDMQETYFEGQETYLEGQGIYLEPHETYFEEQETYLEGQETYLERQGVYLEPRENYLEEQETYLKEQDTYLEGQETYSEGQETCWEDQGTIFEHEGTYLQRNETYFEGLGEETFWTVRNASPRARDLLPKARNLSRYSQ